MYRDFDHERDAFEGDEHLDEVEQEPPRVAPGRRARAVEPTATRRLARGTLPPGKLTRSDPKVAERLRALAAPGKRLPTATLDLSPGTAPAAAAHDRPDAPAVDPAARAEVRRPPAGAVKEAPPARGESAAEKESEAGRQVREPVADPKRAHRAPARSRTSRPASASASTSTSTSASASASAPASRPGSGSGSGSASVPAPARRDRRSPQRIDRIGVEVLAPATPVAVDRPPMARAQAVSAQPPGPSSSRRHAPDAPSPPSPPARADRRPAAELRAVPVQPAPPPRPVERIVQPSFQLRHQHHTPDTPGPAGRPEARRAPAVPASDRQDAGSTEEQDVREAEDAQADRAPTATPPSTPSPRQSSRSARAARPAVQALRGVPDAAADRASRLRAGAAAAGQVAIAPRTVALRRAEIAAERGARVEKPQPRATLAHAHEPARAGRVPEARPGTPPRQAERPAPPHTAPVDCPEPVVPVITLAGAPRLSLDGERTAGRSSLAAERGTEVQVGFDAAAQRATHIAPLPARMQGVIDGSVAPRLQTHAAGRARAADLSTGRRVAQDEIAIYGDAAVAERRADAAAELADERTAPVAQDAGGDADADLAEAHARLREGLDDEVAAVEPAAREDTVDTVGQETRDARLDGDRLDALERTPALRPLDTDGPTGRAAALEGDVARAGHALQGARPEVPALRAPARPARTQERARHERRPGEASDRQQAIAAIEDALVEAANVQYPAQVDQATAPALREYRGGIAGAGAKAEVEIDAALADGQAKQAAIAATPPPVDRAKVQADAGARYQVADGEAAAATSRTQAQVAAATATAATQVSTEEQARQTQVAAADAAYQADVQQAEATRAQEETAAQAGLATATATASSTMAAEQATATATAASERAAAQAQTDAHVQQAEQQSQQQQQQAEQQSQQQQQQAEQQSQQQQQQAQAQGDQQVAARQAEGQARTAALQAQGQFQAENRLAGGEAQAQARVAQGQSEAQATIAAAEARAASLRAQAAAQRAKGGLLNKIGGAIKAAIGGLLAAAAAVLAAARAAAAAILAAARAAAQAILAAARAAARAIIQTFKALIQGVIQMVMAAIRAIVQAVAAAIQRIIAALAAIIQALVAALAAALAAIVEAVRAIIVGLLDALVALVTAIDADLGRKLEAAVQGFRAAVNAAAAVATAAIQAAAVALQAAVQVAASTAQQTVAAVETAYLAAVTAIETALVAAVEVFHDALATAVDAILTAAEQDVDAMITAAEVVLAAFVARQEQAIAVAQVQLDRVVDQVIDAARAAVDALSDAVAWVVDQVPNSIIEGFIDFWNGPWRDMVIIGLATIAAVAITVGTFGTGAPVAALLLAGVIGGVMAGSAYGAGELAARQGEVDLEQDRPDEIYVPNHGYMKPSDVQVDPVTGEMQLPEGVDPTMFQWALSNFDVDPLTGEIQAKSNEALMDYVASEAAEGFVSGFLSAALAVAGAGLGAAVGGKVATFVVNRAVAQGASRAAATGVSRALPAMVGGTVEGSVDVLSGGLTSATTSVIEALESGASMKDAVKGGLETLKAGLTDPTSIGASLLMGVTAGGQAKWIDPRFERGMESGLMRDPAVKRAATDMLIETVSEQAGSGLGLAAVELVGALAAGVPVDEAIRRAVDKGGDYYTLTNIAMSVAMNVAGGLAEADTRRGVFGDISQHLPFGPSPGPDGSHFTIQADGTRTPGPGPSPSPSPNPSPNPRTITSTTTSTHGERDAILSTLSDRPVVAAQGLADIDKGEIKVHSEETGKEYFVTKLSNDPDTAATLAMEKAARIQELARFGGPAFYDYVQVPDDKGGHVVGIAVEKIDGVWLDAVLSGSSLISLTPAHRDALADLVTRLEEAGLHPPRIVYLRPDGRVVPIALDPDAAPGAGRALLERVVQVLHRFARVDQLPAEQHALALELRADEGRRQLERLLEAESRGEIAGFGDWLAAQAAERVSGREIARLEADLADLSARQDAATQGAGPVLDLRARRDTDADAELSQESPRRPPILTDPRTVEHLRQFEHIVMDAHSVRGGQGDVAAAYLTAIDLMNRHRYAGTIDLVVTAQGLSILQRMTGSPEPLTSGSLLPHEGPGTLRVDTTETAGKVLEPADLVLQLAAGSGDVDKPTFGMFRGDSVTLTPDAVLAVQTVFESSEGYEPNAYSKTVSSPAVAHRPPGLRPNEGGVYTDPVALRLRDASPAAARQELLSAIDRMPPDRASEQRVLSRLVAGDALAGSERALAYGLSISSVEAQVKTYVDGLVERARRTGTSTVVITPSTFPKTLRGQVDYYTAADAARDGGLPREATPGRVYVVETGSLPHDVFVGLMADSSLPPIVAGDGALSAAVVLGTPFAMTRVDWNIPVVKSVRDSLVYHADPDLVPLLDEVFGARRPDLHRAADLADPRYQTLFATLAAEVPSVTDRSVEVAAQTRALGERRPPAGDPIEEARGTSDPALRVERIVQRSELGDPAAARLVARVIASSPESASGMVERGVLTAASLRHPSVRRAVEDVLATEGGRHQDDRPVLAGLLGRAALSGDQGAAAAFARSLGRNPYEITTAIDRDHVPLEVLGIPGVMRAFEPFLGSSADRPVNLLLRAQAVVPGAGAALARFVERAPDRALDLAPAGSPLWSQADVVAAIRAMLGDPAAARLTSTLRMASRADLSSTALAGTGDAAGDVARAFQMAVFGDPLATARVQELMGGSAARMARGTSSVKSTRLLDGTSATVESVQVTFNVDGSPVWSGPAWIIDGPTGRRIVVDQEVGAIHERDPGAAVAADALTLPHRPLGEPMDRGQAETMLGMLREPSKVHRALARLGYSPQLAGGSVPLVLWGVGRQADGQYRVVRGSETEVRFGDLEPVAQTLSASGDVEDLASGRTATFGELLDPEHQTPAGRADLARLLPPPSTMDVLAERGAGDYQLATPFVVDGDDRITSLHEWGVPGIDVVLRDVRKQDGAYELSMVVRTAADPDLGNRPRTLTEETLRIQVDPDGGMRSLPVAPAPPPFRNVVVDARNSIAGQGDVAAGYFTAVDLVSRLGDGAQVTLLADASTLKLLSAMRDAPVTAGSTLTEGDTRVRVETVDSLPPSFPVADLYLSMARPSGARKHMNAQEASLIDGDTVRIAQTVFGNTNDHHAERPNANLWHGDEKYEVSPPGLAPGEAGVYADPLAQRLARMTGDQQHAALGEAVGRVPHAPTRDGLRALLEGGALNGSRIGLAYGISLPEMRHQFGDYLTGLAGDAARSGRSYTVVTPSRFREQHIPPKLRDRVKHVSLGEGQAMPATADAGTIYIVETPTLPHDVFVGLMATSEIPPVVAGDNSLSAALALGQPFVMTSIDWNTRTIDAVKQRLAAHADPGQRALLDVLFGDGDGAFGMPVQGDLTHALELLDPANRRLFEAVQAELRPLTDRLLEVAQLARTTPTFEKAMSTADEGMQLSLLIKAVDSDPRAASAVVAALLADPDRAMGLVVTGLLDGRALGVDLVRESLAGALWESGSPWMNDFGDLLVTDPAAALAALDTERVRLLFADPDAASPPAADRLFDGLGGEPDGTTTAAGTTGPRDAGHATHGDTAHGDATHGDTTRDTPPRQDTPVTDGDDLGAASHQAVGRRIATEAEAQDIVRALADGDATVLERLGIVPPSGFDPSRVEWGIGYDPVRGDYVLLVGDGRAVDWSPFPGLVAVAHSHPMGDHLPLLAGPGGDGRLTYDWLSSADAGADRVRFFPSGADFVYLWRSGIQSHQVHTPFRYLGLTPDGRHRIGNPSDLDTGAPGITIEIRDPRSAGDLFGNPDLPLVSADIVVRAGDRVLDGPRPFYGADHPLLGSMVDFDPPPIPGVFRREDAHRARRRPAGKGPDRARSLTAAGEAAPRKGARDTFEMVNAPALVDEVHAAVPREGAVLRALAKGGSADVATGHAVTDSTWLLVTAPATPGAIPIRAQIRDARPAGVDLDAPGSKVSVATYRMVAGDAVLDGPYTVYLTTDAQGRSTSSTARPDRFRATDPDTLRAQSGIAVDGPMSRDDASRAVRQLASGDKRALPPDVRAALGDLDSRSIEWSVARIGDQHFLVKGHSGGSSVPGAIVPEHSHPLPGRELSSPRELSSLLSSEDGVYLVPSLTDRAYTADHELGGQDLLHLPYVLLPDGRVGNPADAAALGVDAPALTAVTLGMPRLTELSNGNRVDTVEVEYRAGDRSLGTFELVAAFDYGTFTPSIGPVRRLETDPAPAAATPEPEPGPAARRDITRRELLAELPFMPSARDLDAMFDRGHGEHVVELPPESGLAGPIELRVTGADRSTYRSPSGEELTVYDFTGTRGGPDGALHAQAYTLVRLPDGRQGLTTEPTLAADARAAGEALRHGDEADPFGTLAAQLLLLAPAPLDVPFLPRPLGDDSLARKPETRPDAGDRRPTLDELDNKLFFVHATAFMPQDGAVGYRADDTSTYRPTVHWALGEMVQEHARWDASGKPYAIVAPLRAVRPQLVNLFPHDSFTVGPQPLSPDTTVVAPLGADVSGLPDGVPVHFYDPAGTTMRHAIDDAIAGAGGWAIRMRDGDVERGSPALLDGVDVDNQDFFHALLAADPSISFGSHLESERGDGYRFGVVDVLLRQSAYSSDPVAAAMIRHHLAEIDRWAAGRDLPARAQGALAERKAHALDLADSIDRAFTGTAAARAAGDSVYLQHPKLFASMDGPELDRFFASGSLLFSQLTDVQRAAFRANWSARRAQLIGPAGAGAEHLDVELVRAFDASGATTEIGVLLRDALDARSPLLDSALGLIRRPDLASALAADWGVTVDAGWPRTLADLLRAHPDTRDAFAGDRSAAETPAHQRAAGALDALGFGTRARGDAPPPASFQDAVVRAESNRALREIAHHDVDEAMTRPLRDVVAPDGLEGGDRLGVYEQLQRDGAERAFARAGLGDQFRARFDSEADFWRSKQTLADVHAELARMPRSGDALARASHADHAATAQAVGGLRRGETGSVGIRGHRAAGGLAAALVAVALAALAEEEERQHARSGDRRPAPPPGWSDDLAAFAGAGERSPFDPSDVSQGALGDCYLLAAIAAIAARDPDLLDALLVRNADGTYTVTLVAADGSTITVTLDGAFPLDESGGAKFAGPGDAGEIWVQLLEKAYAQYMAGQDPLAASGGLDPYRGIGNGGWMGGPFELLTGHRSNDTFGLGRITFDGLARSWREGQAISVSTPNDDQTRGNALFEGDDPKLVNGHAYFVTAVDEAKRTVTIHNPWGWEYGDIVLSEEELASGLSGEASVDVGGKK